MVTRAAILAEAREWVDAPTAYMHQGRTKGLGADCLGLIGGIGLVLGMPSAIGWARDPSVRGYGVTPNSPQLLMAVAKYLNPITPKSAARLADILLLKWPDDLPHFGIISALCPMSVIHCFASAKKCVETTIAGEWRRGIKWEDLIVSAWAYKEVAD